MTTALLTALTTFVLLTGEPSASSEPAKPSVGQSEGQSRLIVIGFDGADCRIVKKLMEQNQLPNLQKLASSGSFFPLKTTNPAQSPVSWAAFNTGMGPDTTNIYDFVCREVENRDTHEKLPEPRPANAMAFRSEADADSYLPFVLRSSMRIPAIAGVGVLLFILFLLLFRAGARFPRGAAVLLSLLLGGVGAGAAASMTRYLPARVPVAKAERRGVPFWKYLDDHGVQTVGLSVPMVFPFGEEGLRNSKILAGLGVPDARQTPGDYFILSNDKDKLAKLKKNAQMGGKFIEMQRSEGSRKSETYEAKLQGPENFWLKPRLLAERKSITESLARGEAGPDELKKLHTQLDAIDSQLGNNILVSIQLQVTPSEDRKRIAVELEHKAVRAGSADLGVGDWSPLTRATFQFNPILHLSVLVRFRVMSIEPLEIYLEPLNLDPKAPPITAPISWPAAFSAELANDSNISDFETLGWACATNPLKDQAIDEKTFLEDIEEIMRQRERLLNGRLGKNDWRLFYMVFGETDRVQHLMFRYFDEQHPLYKKEEAEKQVTFFGRTMSLKDCIPEIYRQADRIVGEAWKRCNDGKTQMMVLSDHGFSSFRRQVHLNSWLLKNGYLVLRDLTEDEKEEIKNSRKTLDDFANQKGFKFVDWSKTRAYSLGLGKIYLNVKGREPQGIVESAAQEALEREIAKKLEADVDPDTGKPFVKSAYLAREIYPDRGKNLKGGERDNSEDLVLGFQEGYRVSWDTTLGGFGGMDIDEKNNSVYCKSFLAPNEEKWSGDHCSIDPSVVTGIFFSTLKLQLPPDAQVPDVRHCAPTILKYFGLEVPQGQRAPMVAAQ
jgi:predicted AlkP superfamily phosphohydrolase/phosphomutase